jgi:hypothetical protein
MKKFLDLFINPGGCFIATVSLRRCVWSTIILVLGTACVGEASDFIPGQESQGTPFVPPTIQVGSTPITLPLTAHPDPLNTQTQFEEPLPTPTPECTPSLTYISDLSFPDGTIVEPGQTLDKRWQVENSGSCNWDHRYRLKLIAGPNLGASIEQAIYPARSNTQTMIRITFTAPDEGGIQRSAWQAHDPLGEPFGDQIFIEIGVQEPTDDEEDG